MHLRLTTRFYYCQSVAGLLMWSALSDERTGLSFTIAAGPCQSSHFRVRVPWDSRLPFSSPPTTRRVRWRYSTPPPHGVLTFDLRLYYLHSLEVNTQKLYPLPSNGYMQSTQKTPLPLLLYLQSVAQQRKLSDFCLPIRCGGNVFSDPLSTNGYGADYIQNTSCNTFYIVACAYFGRRL
jgi:hypothetical protein